MHSGQVKIIKVTLKYSFNTVMLKSVSLVRVNYNFGLGATATKWIGYEGKVVRSKGIYIVYTQKLNYLLEISIQFGEYSIDL